MPRREAERLADALWQILRPGFLAALDAALSMQGDGAAAGGLSPADGARIDAWAARYRRREREQRQSRRQRDRQTPKGKTQ